ncbi:helix-turn-helix transcriptional regulator [Vibrio cholerae]|uniref:helix-turn-helix domain-containing protein n=1 Tax=Vibrio cholerae TaxID=666 RepID=UPI000615ABAE|nr:helix-turn-helix transcriptional regulator [Vibrio cholerae]AKB06718.1 helix-turn-helix family protein [Vibrio cholerae]EGQ9319857.1 helix-turn-helix transcriptional regulator [Vibrio cholerae]EGQ9634506.1 helix-turn-helix transcriptional regulator [Vibrio cholerae]EGQ9645089.1 helix-turn-helix transcriptional regulator [Vibrio cholerae]EGR0029933.1 helix-turn-helix transcriptional regulator [Vibrio cholerae]
MKSVQAVAALLKQRRKALGLEQKDMYLQIGMKQQQYQRVETGSDMKLSTLLRVLEGLGLELAIAPRGSKSTGNALSESDASDLKDDYDDLDFWFSSDKA